MNSVFTTKLGQICVVIYVAALCAACNPPLTSDDLLADGPYIARTKRTYFDDTVRGRSIFATIWYPSESSAAGPGAPVVRESFPHPLIIYSHGFSSFMGEGRYLNRHLATRGYIVIEPQYPLTSLFTPGGPVLADVVNQPADISFMIDTMLSWNEEPGNLFEGTIDPNRIGATGLSLGALTTLLVAYHPDLRDPRIKAAAPIASPMDMFAPSFYKNANVPLLAILSKLDAMIDYEASFPVARDNVDTPTFLVTFFEASHTGWSNAGTTAFENTPNPDTVGCNAIAGSLPSNPAEAQDTGFRLGGPEQGIIDSTARPACSYGNQLITSMRPSRQHELTIIAIQAFFDAFLPEPSKVGLIRQFRSLHFLLKNLERENADEIAVLPILKRVHHSHRPTHARGPRHHRRH